jgi:phosphatidylglycerophosphatase C
VATRVVAAFDFDRTLSTRDNVVPFLTSVAGRPAVLMTFVKALPDLARGHRDSVKARLARDLLGGRDAAEIREISARFGAECVARHLRGDVTARAEWHRDRGHERVIVSASFECYVAPVAAALGFDATLATRLEVGLDGTLTGELDGPNVRRKEKVRRLESWLGSEPVELWVYGDSAGDRELLARADHAVRVQRAPLRRRPIGE